MKYNKSKSKKAQIKFGYNNNFFQKFLEPKFNLSSKRSQIKFGETIGVIIIVYIILMIGLVWYNNINAKDLEEMRLNDLNDRAFEKYYYLVNLDLIHVSKRGNVDEEFNLESIRILSNYSKTKAGNLFLKNQLSDSLVEIKVFNFSSNNNYDLSTPVENITLFNSTPADKEIISVDKFRTLIPIRDDIERRNKIGILVISNFITE